ncbi:hypothetical protein SLEP1_g37619 [Rubroshorea leprosula]|uniref:Uncharacterized protein n=1 Tax=Rubroshorea leprosula TaxID=152421 RepID=A0AAV5KVA8_9ROSI|nr:hypothetical protein SLEP1_g37619 [Rubroshorea leprosula]
MAEAIVSRVLEKLSSVLEEEVRRITNVRGEVEKLTSNFRAIKAVLEDAERQQMGKGKASVRDWLYKLKEVSYDIDNVLDEWSTAIFKSKLEKKKVCSFIPSPSFCFNKGKLLHKIAHKILELNGRLDVIANEREKYGLKELSVEKPSRGEQTTSLLNLAKVCGRVKDEERIVDILLNEGGIDVISIVGVGGIGKTTLAQLAFNNEKVESHFEKRIWVCVSDPFDEMRIAKAILTSLGKDVGQNLVELEDVLRLLRDSIKDKKFLLVLDDVWTEQYERWGPLKDSLSSSSLGSKILVTTRKETVARTMGCTTLFPMGQLSEEEGWLLFSQIAFLGRSNEDSEILREIGKKIAGKCKGLPLALKTMGGLMLLKKTVKEWQSVLDSEIWELEVAEESLFRPLMFSYFDLPSHLRQCFSYCAVFPKDYVIEKGKLIELWMAQGFLKGTKHRDMETVGEDYFNDLSMRSFFQDFEKDENGGIIKCKMHDIVHDFAQFLTRGECLTVEAGSSSRIEGFNESARHVMLRIPYDSDECPTRIYDAKDLHTLLVESDGVGQYNVDLLKLFDKLKCLRILKCHSERINKCPKQIRNLIHLRSLDLSDNLFLEELPDAICDLYNLLILDINGCQNLRSLPCRMGNLKNLWHLRNGSTDCVEFMPKGMEKLTCLRTLSSFVVDSGGKGAALSELGNLIHLRGDLEIRGLRNVRDEREAEKAQLQNKKGLTTLVLTICSTWFGKSQVSEASVLVLEALEPPLGLERLLICGYNCPTPSLGVWPSWIVSLTNLKFFRLYNCVNVEQLPPLGKLPSLESLYLEGIEGVRKVGVEFLGIETSSLSPSSSSSSVVAFPNLKSLEFRRMGEWEEWDYGSRGEEDIKIMPRLSSLEIRGCKKLKMLPDSILQSTTLQNLKIYGSPVISNRCKWEYWPHISRIPNKDI